MSMKWFVDKVLGVPDDEAGEGEMRIDLDRMTDADLLMKVAPDYYRPRFQAIADLRSIDDGNLHRGNEFRRVASLVNVPLSEAMRLTEPGMFKDKRIFYRWLGKHPQYKTYDTRGGSRPSVTVVDGKQVV